MLAELLEKIVGLANATTEPRIVKLPGDRDYLQITPDGKVLTKVEEAMHWLQQRTIARMRRGVEGTHQV